MYFNDIWLMRPLETLEIFPTEPDPLLLLGAPKLGRFARLKLSSRSCSRCPSRTENDLVSETSKLMVPGSIKMLRPALP